MTRYLSASHRRHHQALFFATAMRGFTLIEIAVALFILVLLLGSILVPLATQVEQRKILETQRALDEAREAILGFALLNGRLPRPAVSFSDGVERTAVCASEADCTGFIPWATLGTSKLDAWGKIIRYSVTPAFSNSAFTLSTPATKTVQTRNTAAPFALTNLATNVPAVIFSHGTNNWGTGDGGSTYPDSSLTNTDEDSNASATILFISRGYSGNTAAIGGEFDDIVTWVSMNILANRMISAGKLP